MMKRLVIIFLAFLLVSGVLIFLLSGSWIATAISIAAISTVGVISYKVIDGIFPLAVFIHISKRFKVDESKTGIVLKDIIYKQGNKGDLKLDIYMPLIQKPSATPVTIFIHGGAWLFGGKGDLIKSYDAYKVMTSLRDKGHAIISIDHQRLNKNTYFPHIISDCKDAIKWVRKSAEKYGFNSNSIGVWGQSSGAYLALMAGLTDDNSFLGDQSLAGYSSEVEYIVDHYGPTDMTEFFFLKSEQKRPWFNNKIASMSFDVKPSDKSEFLKKSIESSPTTYIRQDSPVILGFHGSKDSVIKIEQFSLLKSIAEEVDANVQLSIIEGANHAFAGASQKEIESIIKSSVDFIFNHS